MLTLPRRHFIPLLLGNAAFLFACGGGGLRPAEYPETKLRGSSISFTLKDSRKEWASPIEEPMRMDRGDDDTYEQQLPSDFEQKARAKVTGLVSGKGPKLEVHAEVRRSDVTFYNDPQRGDFVRYDVVFGFRVTTARGALLDKGAGGAWQEIPFEKATAPEMRRLFAGTASGALDQYFASEDTLETINEQIERYLEANPSER